MLVLGLAGTKHQCPSENTEEAAGVSSLLSLSDGASHNIIVGEIKVCEAAEAHIAAKIPI